jgi:hypothetical protein
LDAAAGKDAAVVLPSGPSTEGSVVFPLSGAFERAVAARCLAFLVRSTRHPFIGASVRPVEARRVLTCQVYISPLLVVLFTPSSDPSFSVSLVCMHPPVRSRSSFRPYWRCWTTPPPLFAATGSGP